MPHKKEWNMVRIYGSHNAFYGSVPSNFIRVSRAKPGPARVLWATLDVYTLRSESQWTPTTSAVLYAATKRRERFQVKDRCLILGNDGPAVEKLEVLMLFGLVRRRWKVAGIHASSLREVQQYWLTQHESAHYLLLL